jgi:hypothetical protein
MSYIKPCTECQGTNGGHYKTCSRYGNPQAARADSTEPVAMVMPNSEGGIRAQLLGGSEHLKPGAGEAAAYRYRLKGDEGWAYSTVSLVNDRHGRYEIEPLYTTPPVSKAEPSAELITDAEYIRGIAKSYSTIKEYAEHENRLSNIARKLEQAARAAPRKAPLTEREAERIWLEITDKHILSHSAAFALMRRLGVLPASEKP